MPPSTHTAISSQGTSKALKVSSSFALFAQWLDQSLEKAILLGFCAEPLWELQFARRHDQLSAQDLNR